MGGSFPEGNYPLGNLIHWVHLYHSLEVSRSHMIIFSL